MTVPISNVPRRVVLAASGTGPYSFNFEILAATDIAVYEDDTLLTLTTDYTVTINTNGTGSVTLTSAATGSQITIVGDRTIQRATDFTTGGDLFASSLNEELDQQTIFNQQNAEAVDRALKIPLTDPVGTSTTLPKASDRSNKYLAFNASGALIAVAGTDSTAPISSVMEPVVAAASLQQAKDLLEIYKEVIYTITDGAAFEIDPGNGTIQLITLGANRTPKATNFVNGESILLGVDDGSAYTLTWTDATFGASGVAWKTENGVAPTLNTSGLTFIVLWKVGGQVYGARTGNV